MGRLSPLSSKDNKVGATLTSKALAKSFHDYGTNYLNLAFEETLEAYRRNAIATALLEVFRFRPPHVLDIGVGRLAVGRALPFPLASLTLVEPMEWSLSRDIEEFGEESAQRFLGLFEDFPTEAPFREEYDLILLSSVLHEVKSPAAVLRKCHSLLARGGSLLVVVPNRYSVHRLLGSRMNEFPDLRGRTPTERKMGQRRAFSEESLKSLCVEYGFSVVSSRTFFLKPTSHGALAEAIDNGLLAKEEVDVLDRLGDLVPGFGAEILGVFQRGVTVD